MFYIKYSLRFLTEINAVFLIEIVGIAASASEKFEYSVSIHHWFAHGVLRVIVVD